MMPLNYIPRKCGGGYKFTKLQENINNLIYRNDIKIFTKNDEEQETRIQTIRIFSLDIRMKFGIEKCV